jgi:tRNA threonylcarbamoyladenosine biosynthesis protein TsaB
LSPSGQPQGSLIVALESSTRRASVAARRSDRPIADAWLESERAHASDLLPALDRLVTGLGASPSELTAVIVGTGPGSYTGLRVGIATAMGIARASGATVLGVPSGETLCFGACAPGATMILLLDARSGEIYYAKYRRLDDEVETIDPPRVVVPAEVARLVDAEIAIFGDATVGAAAGLSTSALARLRTDVVPAARDLLELGSRRIARGMATPLDVLEPLYLRKFAASKRKI